MSGQGWSSAGDDKIPRQDIAPERFHREAKPGDPACAAWNEQGYVDPDHAHQGLPLGTRYWQGFVKKAAPRAEPGLEAGS